MTEPQVMNLAQEAGYSLSVACLPCYSPAILVFLLETVFKELSNGPSQLVQQVHHLLKLHLRSHVPLPLIWLILQVVYGFPEVSYVAPVLLGLE